MVHACPPRSLRKAKSTTILVNSSSVSIYSEQSQLPIVAAATPNRPARVAYGYGADTSCTRAAAIMGGDQPSRRELLWVEGEEQGPLTSKTPAQPANDGGWFDEGPSLGPNRGVVAGVSRLDGRLSAKHDNVLSPSRFPRM
jgi:hypothetical protein